MPQNIAFVINTILKILIICYVHHTFLRHQVDASFYMFASVLFFFFFFFFVPESPPQKLIEDFSRFFQKTIYREFACGIKCRIIKADRYWVRHLGCFSARIPYSVVQKLTFFFSKILIIPCLRCQLVKWHKKFIRLKSTHKFKKHAKFLPFAAGFHQTTFWPANENFNLLFSN